MGELGVTLGHGGQARVAEATGWSRNTLIAGAAELAGGPTRSERVRRPGAGRKKATDLDPEMLVVLDSLVEPERRGDPMSPLRWTTKSTRTLSAELTRLGHQAGSGLVPACRPTRRSPKGPSTPTEENLSQFFSKVSPLLDERERRLTSTPQD